MPSGLSSRYVAAVAAAALLAACSESSVVSPTSPSTDKVQALAIACPADAAGLSPSGVPIPVDYSPPVVQGGLSPVTTECDPASGSTFSVGGTTVTCEAPDAVQQAVSCTLLVSVQESLGIARIVAFGDSITRSLQSDLIFRLDRADLGTSFDPTETYPARLQQLLGADAIEVINAGLDGELAVDALPRFMEVLAGSRPDSVLIMEGTNDLCCGPERVVEIPAVAAAVESLVVEARRQGVDPIMATISPQRSTPQAFLPPVLSDRLRQVAVRQNVPLVDIYTLPGCGSPRRCRTSAPGSSSPSFSSS